MTRTLREWTLHDELGRGGMGVVWRATHAYLRGAFAVKQLRGDLLDDDQARARFLREAALAVELEHGNVVRSHPPFEYEGVVYLPMEHLSGRSLAQRLAAEPGPMALNEALRIVAAAAEGLGYAHRRTPVVLHRDVKPGNLFLCDDGRVKLLDFGLAWVAGEGSLTNQGLVVGTPLYLAPEVLEGARPTAQADVFGLGVVLYRLLAGRPPVDVAEDSPLVVQLRTLDRAYQRGLPDVRETRPDVPAALAELLAVVLAANPAERPADGAAVAAALATAGPYPPGPPLHLRGEGGGALAADTSLLRMDLPGAVVSDVGARLASPAGLRTADPQPGEGTRAFALGENLAPGTIQEVRLPPAGGGDPVAFRFAWIPVGTFWMGSPNDDPEAFSNEKPRHRVTLTKPFWMQTTPVTQAQWRAVMATDPSRFKGDDRPVEQVSWCDAVVYCDALSKRVGEPGFRLPTEAEWEYACRAGSEVPRYGDLDRIAWWDGNSGETHVVGQKEPNAWGLHDTLGNVWEWCQDGAYRRYGGDAHDPVHDPDAGAVRVVRGGSWGNYARRVRAADRYAGGPSGRLNDLGFRLARSAQ